MQLSIDHLAATAGLAPIGDRTRARWRGCAIASAAVASGDVFLALRGAATHGIDYAAEAVERGAAAICVGNDADADLVEAASRLAPTYRFAAGGSWALMAALGRAMRRERGYLVVAVTGSTGKTSTKDILRAMLQPHAAVHASHGNFNNEVGVPLTLLQAPASSSVVICEMGMRGAGQIEYLCGIAEPDVGIITNAGPVHLEMVGGSVANVVAAKAELAAGVGSNGAIVLPAAQPELAHAAASLPDELWRFAPPAPAGGEPLEAASHATVTDIVAAAAGLAGTLVTARYGRDPQIESFQSSLHGAHHAANIAAAAAASRAVEHRLTSGDGVPWQLADGLSDVVLSAGRGDRYPLPGGGILLDSSYNANPVSMRAALAELAHITVPGRRLAVLGEMAELGESSAQHHQELGEAAAVTGIDALVVVGTGPLADRVAAGWNAHRTDRQEACIRADDPPACIDMRDRWLGTGDAVLIKASNAAGLGSVVEALRSAGVAR